MAQNADSCAAPPRQARADPKTPKTRETNRLASRKYRLARRAPSEPVVDLLGEVWKPVMGMEKKYAISSYGRVKRLERTEYRTINTSVTPGKLWPAVLPEKLRKLSPGRNGYLMVSLRGSGKPSDTHAVHVLVCEAFHGPRPEGMLATHRDDDRLHNHADNVRWGTALSNAADAKANGRLKVGLDNFNGKLTDEQISIARGSRGIVSSDALASILSVSGGTVRRLIRTRESRPQIAPAPQAVVLDFILSSRTKVAP